RARLAQSTFMSFQSQANLTRFPQLSALLAVEAVRVVAPDRDSNAESALRKVLSSIGGRGLGLMEAPVYSVATSQDGRWLAAGSGLGGAGNTVRLWNRSLPEWQLRPVTFRELPSTVDSVSFSADSRRLVALAGNAVVLWDLVNGPPYRYARLSAGEGETR